MIRPRILTLAVLALLFAPVANASWYDDYEDGVAAARSGNWQVVVQKMTSAIKGQANENNRARTYGAIFINYHPYYYRGIANLNTGRYEQAIADLEKTMGPGELDLGPIATHLERAKKQLEAASAPPPDPRPDPVRPPVTTTQAAVVPAGPVIDAALRQRAAASINSAKLKLQSAQQRGATSSQQYTQAMSIFTQATTKNAQIRSNDDLQDVIAMAENASTLADLAMPPAPPTTVTPPVFVPPAITPKPTTATGVIMSDYTDQVRRALENYFAGEFESAARDFEDLSRKMPNNGWIFAFLGASQYSLYAFEADESHRSAAERSFQKAKQLRTWRNGLPERYFSRRIRQAFNQTAG